MSWGHKKRPRRGQDYEFSMWWGLPLTISLGGDWKWRQSAEMRFSALGVWAHPWEWGEDLWHPAHCGLEWSIYQSAADGCLSVEAFRPETTEGDHTQSSSVLTPRGWWWTHICYWDVEISAQFSLLPLLLLLHTQMGMLRDWLLNYQAKNAIEPCNFIQ